LNVIYISKAITAMVRAEPMTNRTTGTDNSHLIRLTILLVPCGQSWIWFEFQSSLSRAFAADSK